MIDLKSLNELLSDPVLCAEKLNLKYWNDFESGILRKKWGRGFRFYYKGKYINDKDEIEYFKNLGIPPNWTETYISPFRDSHIVSVGKDAKQRRQYLYHDIWTGKRKIYDYYAVLFLAENLEKIREKASSLLDSEDEIEVELGAILELLDRYYLRIGNEAYFNKNGTIGITTLLTENIDASENCLQLVYDAKSNQERVVEIRDQELDDFFEKKQMEEGQVFKQWTSKMVNDFLKEFTGAYVTAKNFRTWGGTLEAYRAMCNKSYPKKEEIYEVASDKLGNTKAIAKSSYIHPHVIIAYEMNKYNSFFKKLDSKDKYEIRLIDLMKKLVVDKDIWDKF